MQWIIFAVACALGTVQHFLYAPLGRPRGLQFLLPVSESPWEHYKLAFWPLCAGLTVWGCASERSLPAILCACCAAAFHGFCTMEGIYYFYRAALGVPRPVLYADIGNFFVTMFLGWRLGLRVLARDLPMWLSLPAGLLLAFCGVLFVCVSIAPPAAPLFQASISTEPQ